MNKDNGDRSAPKQESFTEQEAHTWAWDHAYTRKGKPVLPGYNLQRAFVQGAGYSKGKGRASLKNIAAAVLQVKEFDVALTSPDPVIDKRCAVIPATRGRILTHRLQIPLPWKAEFTIHFDDRFLSEKQVRQIVDDTG